MAGFKFVFRKPISMMFALFLKWYKTLLWRCYSEKVIYQFFSKICLLKFQTNTTSVFLPKNYYYHSALTYLHQIYTLTWPPPKSSLTHFHFINYTFPFIIPTSAFHTLFWDKSEVHQAYDDVLMKRLGHQWLNHRKTSIINKNNELSSHSSQEEHHEKVYK